MSFIVRCCKHNQVSINNASVISQNYLPICNARPISFWRKKKKVEEEDDDDLIPLPETDPIEDPFLDEKRKLSEDEILRIRDKSGLSDRLKVKQLGLKPEIKFLNQFRKVIIRRIYAEYGRASGLKPGVAWPSKPEFEIIKGYEKTFYPSLQEMLKTAAEKREKERQAYLAREKEVLDNLKKLPKWKKEFFSKYNQRIKNEEAEKAKKEQQIQDVRDFLGYDIDASDVRFQETLMKKEEAERKSKGQPLSKTKQRQAELIAELQELAKEAMAGSEENKGEEASEKGNEPKDA